MDHRCSTMPKDVHLCYSDIYTHDKQWFLHITEVAEEGDLEYNTVLNNVGDIIWQAIVNIRYCPYCGECLCKINEEHFHRTFHYTT